MKKDKCLYTLPYHRKLRLRRRPPQYMAMPVKRKLALRWFRKNPWGKCA